MNSSPFNVLVVGATGSIGRLVVEQALLKGHAVRALVRDRARARHLPAAAERCIADLTQPSSLHAAVQGISAVVFTHGSNGGAKRGPEQVDYGGVRNVLAALGDQQVRIALMTAIGVTNRAGAYNRATQAPDWKRRGERLVRCSGHPYTIVRPGWFDYHAADQLCLKLLQGDRRHAGDPRDGVVSRLQIAQVLVHSLSSAGAAYKTFELVAERGQATENFDDLFDALAADVRGGLDGVQDTGNMPLDAEPESVIADLQAQRQRSRQAAG
jgi:uncharacterized protein YbjT (DUF2867 family)